MHDRAGHLFRLRQAAATSLAARACVAAGVAATGAGLTLNMPTPVVGAPEIRLVDVEAAEPSLGGGTALILGASGIPTPTQGFADAIDALYLQPHGFTGAIQAVTTPESLYPFTGPPETMTEVLGPLLTSAQSVFDLDASSSPYFSTDLSNELTGVENWFVQGLSEISSVHTGIPSIDMASTALTTLPQIAEQLYDAGIAASDPLDAIGDPLALFTGLAPLMLAGALS